MRVVSDRFLATIRGSHRMVADARICTTFQTGDNPTGTDVGIMGGDVRYDASASIRSTLDLTTDGTGWNPTPTDLLAPWGNEVFVRRGVDLGGGTREWVPLGYYRMYDVDQDNAPDGPVRIEARDRMSGIIDARMTAPVQFFAAHTVAQVFERLVLEVYPDVEIEYDFTPTALALSRTIVVEEDRYAALRDLAWSLGRVMYFDHRGVLQVRVAPSPADPVWSVDSGPNGVLVSMSRTLSREGSYNAVVATGEAPDDKPPARGMARDMSKTSPTYWFGRFGKVPRFYTSPFITTNAQARYAARQMLARSLGLPYNVDFSAVPNPALEVLDPIAITHPRGSELHIVDRLTIPLVSSAPMSGSTRQKGPEEIQDLE